MKTLFALLFTFFISISYADDLHEGECLQEEALTEQVKSFLSIIKKNLEQQPVSREFCKQLHECYGGLGYYEEGEEFCIESDPVFTKNGFCGLKRQELIALTHYMGGLYLCLNKSLYTGQKEKFPLLTSTINAALDRFPQYEGFVFRGSSLPQSVIDQHKVGAIVNYPAFTSTSTDEDVSQGFGGQMFLIYSKTGRPVMGLTAYEKEVLFKADTNFRVLQAQDNKFIMREVTGKESKEEEEAEDKRILELAKEAANKKESKTVQHSYDYHYGYGDKDADTWICPIDPHNIPKSLNQKHVPDTSFFFQ